MITEQRLGEILRQLGAAEHDRDEAVAGWREERARVIDLERLLAEVGQPSGQPASPSSRLSVVCPSCRTVFPAALAAA